MLKAITSPFVGFRCAVSKDFRVRPNLHGTTLVLVAGVMYLLVRARTIRVFGGIDLRTDAGWDSLKASLRASAAALFAPLSLTSGARRHP